VASNTKTPVKGADNVQDLCWMDATHVAMMADNQVWEFSLADKQAHSLAKTFSEEFLSCAANYIIDTEGDIVNMPTGDVAELPDGAELGYGFGNQEPALRWLPNAKLLFEQGLNNSNVKIQDRGTWLYDLATQKATRVSPYPFVTATLLSDNATVLF